MSTGGIGDWVLRGEDIRLVTGNGAFLDDLGPDTYEAAFVRSPFAHAAIKSVDTTEATTVEGVVGVYTHADLPPKLQQAAPLLIPHDALTHPRTIHHLADDHVNHVGEPVAMVVASNRYIAEDAAARVLVDYDILDPVIGIEAAEAADRLVHDDVPGNVAAHLVQSIGDSASAIAAAPHVLELEFDIERSASTPLETRGVFAHWDGIEARLTVHSSTQTPTSVRAAVAALLDLPLAKVDCIAPDVGGGFGVKIVHPWPEEALIPWAARELKHDVKYTEDRREHFVAAAHERSQKHRVRVGFDDDGRIAGLEVRFLHDNGAYIPYGLIVPLITSTQLLGPYRIENYTVEFKSLYTNTTIVTPYRGAGRPQGCFVMERTVDRIAGVLGKDRTRVRELNFIQPDEMPYDFGLQFQDGRPYVYDSGDYPAALTMLKEMIQWDEFPDFQARARAEGRLVGIGVAGYVEGTGLGPYEGGHVHVEPGGRIQVATGLSTQGQGHKTVFAQIVAEELGVPFESVDVVTGDSRRMGYAVGTFASRAAVTSGNAIAIAARKVREKAIRIAAESLEAAPEDLEIVDAVVRVKGAPGEGIPLNTVAILANPLRYAFDEASRQATQFSVAISDDDPPVPDGEEPGLEATGFYSPVRGTFANGVHACIVEVDPETSEIEILKYAVIHDCGTLINPMIVEGQVQGGVAQGVGGALYERMAYSELGQLQNASFMDFLMPYATEIPPIDIGHLETPSPLNALGVKGAGEAGVIPAAGAIAAAIEDAVGLPIDAMPISPSQLHEMRVAARRAP